MDAVGSLLRWRRLPALVELVSIGIGYGLYSLVRLLAPHRVVASYAHAHAVLDVEKALGMFHEVPLNTFLIKHEWLVVFSSYWYATAHFVVTPLVLAWLWRHRAWAYSMMRSAIVIATVGALVVYATWPLAPPRFVVPGVTDTVMENPVVWAKQGAASFVNEYAAMPSLHVGWAIWCAVAVVAVVHSPWRHLAWLYPLTTTLVVSATANHYFLDAVGGTVFVAVPLWLCGLRARHLWRADALVPEPRGEVALVSAA
ncbi:MAG TPA: phosphatase PAP2 family protein [Mycobacteriales bacterium]|nr:phosphatase PAP2 family protein [Mycobacteriales bacterium]